MHNVVDQLSMVELVIVGNGKYKISNRFKVLWNDSCIVQKGVDQILIVELSTAYTVLMDTPACSSLVSCKITNVYLTCFNG